MGGSGAGCVEEDWEDGVGMSVSRLCTPCTLGACPTLSALVPGRWRVDAGTLRSLVHAFRELLEAGKAT